MWLFIKRCCGAVVFVFLCGDVAQPWEAITHFQLGVESGIDASGSFQNLPDSWPSHGNIFTLYGITEWFAWSHGVQLTGRSSVVPNVPRYPKDNRNPGEDLYRLYKTGTVAGSNVYETAIGFLGHVFQDRQVHYRYFRGGSRSTWVEEHQKKEQWADCMIYLIKLNGKFNDQGHPLNLPNIENKANSPLVSEGQKIFMASGLSVDSDENITLPKRETSAEIESRLSGTKAAIRDYLNNFDKWHCQGFAKYVKNYDWTLDELEEYYKKSLDITRNVVLEFPR